MNFQFSHDVTRRTNRLFKKASNVTKMGIVSDLFKNCFRPTASKWHTYCKFSSGLQSKVLPVTSLPLYKRWRKKYLTPQLEVKYFNLFYSKSFIFVFTVLVVLKLR